MARHFRWTVHDGRLVHERDHARIDAEARLDVHERDHARTDAEARLDGIYVLRTGEPVRAAHRRARTCCAPASPYVLRTGEPAGRLSPEDTVRTCKGLADAERWFRTLKGLDIRVRPIRHREERRVGAHRLVCPPRASSTPSRPST